MTRVIAWMLIFAIRFYQICLRPFVRRRCLFAESCSRFAIRKLKTVPLGEAWAAIRWRFRVCRPKYAIAWSERGGEAILADGSRVDVSELAIRCEIPPFELR